MLTLGQLPIWASVVFQRLKLALPLIVLLLLVTAVGDANNLRRSVFAADGRAERAGVVALALDNMEGSDCWQVSAFDGTSLILTLTPAV